MASLAKLTADAVLAAVAQCDELGERLFLAKHGYRPSNAHELVVDGRRYPSKAIVGVALGLRPSEFSGGLSTVGRALKRCGFDVERKRRPESFALDAEDYPGGVHQCGTFNATYGLLRCLFGEPNSDGDRYKISTEWQFVSDTGEPVCLYDWKMTNLYAGHMTVEQFRSWTCYHGYEWHVGARSREVANAFIAWLEAKRQEGLRQAQARNPHNAGRAGRRSKP